VQAVNYCQEKTPKTSAGDTPKLVVSDRRQNKRKGKYIKNGTNKKNVARNIGSKNKILRVSESGGGQKGVLEERKRKALSREGSPEKKISNWVYRKSVLGIGSQSS